MLLNTKKCEVISNDGTCPDTSLRDFVRIKVKDAVLLGAPLFEGGAMDAMLDAWCANMVRASERLKLLDAHDALVLLGASFNSCNMVHHFWPSCP